MPFERVGGQEVRAEESRGDDEVERKEGEAARPEAANSAELATGCFIRWAVEAVDRRRGSEGRRVGGEIVLSSEARDHPVVKQRTRPSRMA
jgi:hypothetical protein